MPKVSTSAVWGHALAPGAAKPRRPVSIRLITMRSRSSWNTRNLPRRRTLCEHLPVERRELGSPCPASRATGRPSMPSLGRPTRAAWLASARMSRSGSSGIGASYVVLVARTACGRLRGHCPQEGRAARAPERRSLSSPPATRTTSRSRKPGRAARALSSPGREPHHPRRCIHLTEPQQERDRHASRPPRPPSLRRDRARVRRRRPARHEVPSAERRGDAAAGERAGGRPRRSPHRAVEEAAQPVAAVRRAAAVAAEPRGGAGMPPRPAAVDDEPVARRGCRRGREPVAGLSAEDLEAGACRRAGA